MESFRSLDLKSKLFLVNKLTSKLKKDFFPAEIPLVRRSKSTILCSLNISVLIELKTECFISLLRLQTILFQFSDSFFGVTQDCMFMYKDFKFLESTVP